MATAGFGASQAIRLIGNLIITRLVAPEAFGLMAVAFALQMWLAMLTDFGVNTSVIRSKSAEDDRFLATAWTVQVARDVLIAGVFALAGLALVQMQAQDAVKTGSIYADPRLSVVIWAVCVSTLIGAFRSIKLPLAQRNIALRRLVAMEIGAQILAVIVMVAAARAGAGVYSLAIGMIASSLFTTVMSFLMFQGPSSRFDFERAHFSELFHFGKWLLIASVFGFFINRGDKVLFGYLMPSEAFSIYAVAGIWIAAIEALVATILQKVAFPALSEVSRRAPEKLTETYETFRTIANGACFAIFLGVFFLSDFVFGLLYTDAYSGVAYYARLLSPMILLLPYRVLHNVLIASGESKRYTAVTLSSGAAFLIMTPLMFSLAGEKAAIVTVALLSAFALPLAWRFGAQRVTLKPAIEAPPVIAALLAAIYLAAG
ncbi:MAG: oligosaccharide flippase family protein [Pseudomonadota bacterium]